MEIENFAYKIKLFDIYKEVLSNKKRLYMSKYFEEDYSITEIANMYDVSRQAVHDTIKRTSDYLENLEDKIGYLKRENNIREKLTELKKSIDECNKNEKLKKIIDEI